MLNKIRISHKIIFLSFLSIMVAFGMMMGGTYAINKLGDNIKAVAEEDVPLANAASTITIHQLEQAVLFEKALLKLKVKSLKQNQLGPYANLNSAQDAADLKKYNEIKKDFIALGTKIDKEIAEAQKLVAHVLKIETDPKVTKEFKHVGELLTKIKKEHADYDKHIKELFSAYENNYAQKAESLLPAIEKEEAQIIHELEALTEEVQAFTLNTAKKGLETETQMARMIRLGSIIAIAIVAFLGFNLVRSIVGPLRKLTGFTKELAEGNLEIEIEQRKIQDEIKEVTDALIILQENSIKAKHLEEESKKQVQKKLEQSEILQSLTNNFDVNISSFVENLEKAAQELTYTSESLLSMSDNTQETSSNLNQASNVAQTNVSSVATASEEMNASITEINSQIGKANRITQDAVVEVEQASQAINELESSSEKIGEIVTLIQEIADQTNLLALNATIESARSGEAGKGFAVVANEVKSLAAETAKATDEIARQIGSMQDATRNSVEAISRITTTIQQVNDIASSIATAMEEQTSVMGEVVRNTTLASNETTQVGEIATIVANNATEAQKTSTSVKEAANDLASKTNSLKQEVSTFLDGIHKNQ